jgi:hypothetical protein
MKLILQIDAPDNVHVVDILKILGCDVTDMNPSQVLESPRREVSLVSLDEIILRSPRREVGLVSLDEIIKNKKEEQDLTYLSKKYLSDCATHIKFTKMVKSFATEYPVYDFFDSIDRQEVVASLIKDWNVRAVNLMMDMMDISNVKCVSFKREIIWQIMSHVISKPIDMGKWHCLIEDYEYVVSPTMAYRYNKALQNAGSGIHLFV